MKTSLKTFFLAAVCTGGFALLPTGCATQSPTVAESTGEYIDDNVITTTVAGQLVEDLGINKDSVTVQTFKGVVTLTGTVASSALRDRAGRIAAAARGVHDVKNDLTLMSAAPMPTPPASTQP